MKRYPPCINWAEKLALRHEDLSTADLKALDIHVQSCDACKTAQDEYNFLDARLKALPLPTVKPFPRLPTQFFHDEEEGFPPASRSPRRSKYGTAPNKGPKHGSVRSILERALAVGVVAALILAAFVFFNQRTPQSTEVITYNVHTNNVTAVAWSPDQRRIASASWDKTVRVWNAQTGVTILTYSGHGNLVCSVAWSPDGKYIASGDWDGQIHVWDARLGDLVATSDMHSGRACAVAWSPDGKYVASGKGNFVQIWSVDTKSVARTYTVNDFVNAVAWSPDGKYIAAASKGGSVPIWDINSGSDDPFQTYTEHLQKVLTLSWSPDGKSIASGGNDGELRVWDIHTKKEIFTYKGQGEVQAVAWSPDGKSIASGIHNEIQLYDVSSQELVYTYNNHAGNVVTLAWSPLDGKRIASGSDDAIVQVWSPGGESMFFTP